MNNYVVYFHKNPQTLQVFYVGIGQPERPYYFRKRGQFWKHYVQKHGSPIVDVIHEGLTLDEAKAIECQYIAQFGRRDINENGTLVNRTSGGDYRDFSNETRKRISEATSRGMKGRVMSEQRKELQRQRITGKRHSEETRAKIAQSVRIAIAKKHAA